MNKILLGSWLLLLLFCLPALAQDVAVSGRVTSSDDGSALPGVSIQVKGTTRGSTTDANGNYQINVAGNSRLVFSFIGFTPREIAVGNQLAINVELTGDANNLDELVVVAYGVQRKRDVTGSIASINSKDIKDLRVAGLDQALQGQAAGVQVTQASGTPGGGVSIRVRGGSSINASNEPLYVIDGVPISTGSYSQIGTGGQQSNALADINPADIESIEILKDASSTALYGSRASNGVVLVTTKRGKEGKPRVNINAYYGTQSVWRKIDVLNGSQFAELVNEARVNRGQAVYAPTVLDPNVSTDWQSLIFRPAPIAQYDASVSGGTNNTKYYISGTYFNQDGIIIGSNFNRGSTRFNLDQKINTKIGIGVNATLSRSRSNRINGDNNIFGVLSTALLNPPNILPYNADGTYGRRPDLVGTDNPLAQAYENDFLGVNTRGIGNVFGTYEIIPGLTFRSQFGIDYLNLKEDRYEPTTTASGASVSGRGIASVTVDKRWSMSQVLSYNKRFKDVHYVSATIGYSLDRSDYEFVYAEGTNFPSNDFRRITSAAVKSNASSNGSQWAYTSKISRASYSYKDRYTVQASVVQDGSSRFGADNRFGIFPAVSAAWVVSDEPFLRRFSALSTLKLRGSYGVTGNSEIDNFASRGLYGSGNNYIERPGTAPTQLPNPDLKWERTTSYEIGADIGFLNNRLNGSFAYYNRQTRDLLLNAPVPSTTGFTTYFQNVGSLENKGFEFQINTKNLVGAFRWETDLNMTFNRNKVLSLVNNQPINLGFASQIAVGQPVGTFFGHYADGVYANNEDNTKGVRNSSAAGAIFTGGDIIFRDLDGNNIIDNNDRGFIGNAQPDFYGGITNRFSYKGIELSVFGQFVYGNEIYNNTRNFGEGMNSLFGQSASTLRRWRKQGDVTDIPKAIFGDPINNRRASTRWVEDGSFLRVKNITLSYNLPASLLSRAKINNVRVYATAQNAFTFTNYKGFDPEVSTLNGDNQARNAALGTDFLTFPQARVITFGINLGL